MFSAFDVKRSICAIINPIAHVNDSNNRMTKAPLINLRVCCEPAARVDSAQGPLEDDESFIEMMTRANRRSETALDQHRPALRRFSEALILEGQTISGLDHDSRVRSARRLFPRDKNLISALNSFRAAELCAKFGS